MHSWHDIDPKFSGDDFLVIIEITKGSKVKYELDKRTGLLKLDRILYTSTHYPANYGFIPRSYARDLDPLDVLLISSEPILPLTLVHCKPLGVIRMKDSGFDDEKIIAVALDDPSFSSFRDISELPEHLFSEMQHFFEVYKALEKKKTAVESLGGKEEAISIIKEALRSYQEHYVKEEV